MMTVQPHQFRSDTMPVPAALSGLRGQRLLDALAIAETITLVVLLINLVTSHTKAVTTSIGPLHGVLYVAVIILALIDTRLDGWKRFLAIIPGLGAPALIWVLRNDAAKAT